MKKFYTPREKRKKILLLTDDIRVTSGVAQIGREMVINTAQRYNWVQLAGIVKHPDKGKKIDISDDINKHAEIDDASVTLYPTDGYGNPDLLRRVIELEKPDAVFLITDPRYFTWVFQMEHEIRKTIPIVYLNIWDDYPAPQYNEEFYESCDGLLGISKQTVNINEIVLGDKVKDKVLKYVPHGLNHKIFKPLPKDDEGLVKFRKDMYRDREWDFNLLFNSRNIRRKSIPDTILAWKLFLDKLPQEKRERCLFTLHTQPIDEHGTDLLAVVEYLFPNKDSQIVFSTNKFSSEQMNYLYNLADGVILLSSNEGWGLSLTESLLTGTPFIANVTGGMQDQMRFTDKNGKWYTPSLEIPSNHRKTFTQCGKWALPVFPNNISLVGSVPTPYIFDDRCGFEDAADKIYELWSHSKKEREEMGQAGLDWALGDEAGFTSEKMGERIIEGVDETIKTFKPRKDFNLYKDTDYKKRELKHNLTY